MVCQSTDVRGCFGPGIDKNLIIRKINTKNYGFMKNKFTLRLGNVNVTTVKNDDKLTQVVLGAKNLGQAICVTSETHRVSSGVELIENWPEKADLDGWKFVGTGNSKKAEAGVGVILSPDCEIVEQEVILESRILYLRILYRGVKMQLYCTYAPTNMKGKTRKNEFFRKLQKSVTEKSAKYDKWPKLIVGDMNATFGHDCPETKFIGRNLDTYPTTDMGQRLAEFLIENAMFALNTLFETKKSHRVTFSLGKTKKRLDYVLADNFFRICCKNARSYPNESAVFETNHVMVMAELRLPCKFQRKMIFKKRDPKLKPLLTSLRDDPMIREQFDHALEDQLSGLSSTITDTASTNELDDYIRSAITAASTVLPKFDPKFEDWMSVEYVDLVKKFAETRDRKKKLKTGRKLKKMRIKLRNEFYEKRADLINNAAEMRLIEEEYRVCKNMKMADVKKRLKCPKPELATFFGEHLAPRPTPLAPELSWPNIDQIIPKIDVQICDETPSDYEIGDILEHMKNGKCRGTDEINSEHLKYSNSPLLFGLVYSLIEKVWNDHDTPTSWKTSRLQPVYKNKGSQTDPAMHRGIMINACISKVLVTSLLNRLRMHYEKSILPSQFGFRLDKSTTDAIFCVRQLLLKTPGEVYGCFIDLKAAYDHICRITLWRVLEMRIGDNRILTILKKLYENTTAKIAGCDTIIDVMIGLRQGGPESCVLFNYYLDTVLRIAHYKFQQKLDNPGITHTYNISGECTDRQQRHRHPSNGSQNTCFVNFADDIYLTAKSQSELQEMMIIITETFQNFGLTLSTSKTETMSWRTPENIKNESTIISVNNKPLKNVRKFKYLGDWISDDIKNNSLLSYQFGSSYAKWNEWKDVLTDHRIRLKTRVMFAESVIRSRLTYAVQTDRLKVAQRKQIDSVWARMLRKMVKNGFAKKPENPHASIYENEDILKICSTKSASEFCQIQHIKFLAHIARQENDTLQKQWLFTSYQKTKCQWLPLANDLGIDPVQLRVTLFNKKKLNELLYATPAPGL